MKNEEMIIQKIGDNKNVITVVCCQHGDEIFGEKVFNYILENRQKYQGVKLILANVPALDAKKRFLETDLNRSFPGKISGSREERLAHEILPELKDCEYLLDIHTTVTDVKLAPIVTQFNEQTKRVVNLCSSKEVALILSPLADKAMIGQVNNGVSLEYNKDYAKTEKALIEVVNIIDSLLSGKSKPKIRRNVYRIDGTILKSVKIPKTTRNYRKIRGLGLYPFLYSKDSYPDIHCLSATTKKIRII